MYTERYQTVVILNVVSILVVVVVNVIMRFGFLLISKFEKFATRTAEEASKFLKFFISAFMNMTLLLLIINLDFSGTDFFKKLQENLPGGGYLFSGKYQEFNRGWYCSVGESIASLMFIQIFWPQLLEILLWVPINLLWRYIRREKAVIQADLNDLYEGTHFELWDRYAFVLANIFFALTFSTGIPILIPFVFAYLLIRYWIDKILCTFIYDKK